MLSQADSLRLQNRLVAGSEVDTCHRDSIDTDDTLAAIASVSHPASQTPLRRITPNNISRALTSTFLKNANLGLSLSRSLKTSSNLNPCFLTRSATARTNFSFSSPILRVNLARTASARESRGARRGEREREDPDESLEKDRRREGIGALRGRR